jgi:uncharacterized protein (TIRG00374 family)
MSTTQKKNIKIVWYLKLIVGFLLIYFLYRNIYQHQRITDVWNSAAPGYILAGFLLLFLNIIIQFIKWRYILRTYYPGISNILVLKSLLFGITLGFITPGNLGELARALYFKNYDRMVITGLNIADKFSGILIFTTIGLFSLNYLLITQFRLAGWVGISLTMLNFLVIVLLWLLAFNLPWLYRMVERLPWGTGKSSKLKGLILGIQHLTRRDSAIILTITLGWFLVIIWQYHLLMLAFRQVSFLHSFFAVSAALFTKVVLPISVGDLGIREGATVYYYSLFNVPQTAAFNTAFLIFFINFLIPALIGSYFVFRLHWESTKTGISRNSVQQHKDYHA